MNFKSKRRKNNTDKILEDKIKYSNYLKIIKKIKSYISSENANQHKF